MPISDGTAPYTYRETEIRALPVARATAFFEAAGFSEAVVAGKTRPPRGKVDDAWMSEAPVSA